MPAYVKFSKIDFSHSNAISGLLIKKSNAKNLVKDHLNIFIWATKLIDKEITRIKVLEQWHRLKVYGIPLIRYLREGKIEVFCQEIESSMEIKLKTTPRWLINEVQLEEHLKTENKKRSAIIIIVTNETNISKLCTKRFRFGDASKVVEKY